MALIILCDVLIFVLGILLGRICFSKTTDAEKDLELAKMELGDLRNKMKQHLSETAFLFQQFDDHYHNLLQHFGDMSKDISSTLAPDQDDPKVISSVKSLNDLKKTSVTSNQFPSSAPQSTTQPKDYEDK